MCRWPSIYKYRVKYQIKSYFELKRIYHYLLQNQKWQSVGTKVLIVYIQKKIAWLQLLKRWIRVSPCNLQKEHKGEGVFPKRNNILLRYNTLLSILYWKALQFVVLLVSLGRRYINFQSKFETWNKEWEYCCEVCMLVF